MKTKAAILFLILIAFSANVKAQLTGKRFELKMEQMGTFKMEFKESTYELSNEQGTIMVLGNYKVEEETILFTDTEGPMACSETEKGKYKFSLTNKELKMELIEDSCSGRPVIATKPWIQL